MSLNHLKDPAKGLVASMERVVLAMPELVEEGLGRITWVSFMVITEGLLITEVQEASGYIMVRYRECFI